MIKGFVKAGLLCLAVSAAGASLAQGGQIVVTVNGQPVQFNAMPPQMVNGRVLVPLRGVFEQMGAYVHWTAATQTVDAQRGDTTVDLQIGNNTAEVNHRQVHMDVAPEIMSDTTLVPLRFISEALGADVDWDSARMTVAIRTNGGGAPDEHIRVRHPDEHPRHEPPPPPPVQRIVIEIPEDMVIPVRLDTPLSSNHSIPGTPIRATLNTNGRADYHGLPRGTMVFGHVLESRPHRGQHPGILTMSFDTLVLPNHGPQIPVQGKLVGLNDEDVSRAANGELIARPGVNQSPNQIAIIGFGSNGFSFGAFGGGHVVQDPHIGGRYNTLVIQLHSHPEQARDVYLPRGAELGVEMRAKVYFR